MAQDWSRSQGIDNDLTYFDFDALGSTAGVTGSGPDYLNKYVYEPFGGTLLATETVITPFQYVGAWGVTAEENGLDFMHARTYSLDDGRFISVDPLRLGRRCQPLPICGKQPCQFGHRACDGALTRSKSGGATPLGQTVMCRPK